MYVLPLCLFAIFVAKSHCNFPDADRYSYEVLYGYEMVPSDQIIFDIWMPDGSECSHIGRSHGCTGIENGNKSCKCSREPKFLRKNTAKEVWIRVVAGWEVECVEKFNFPMSILAHSNNKGILLQQMRGRIAADQGFELKADSYMTCAYTAIDNGCSVFEYPKCRCCMEDLSKCLEQTQDRSVVTVVNTSAPVQEAFKKCHHEDGVVLPEELLALGEWQEWPMCSEECGGAHRNRTRFVIPKLRKEFDETEVEVCNDQTCERPRTTCNTGFKKLSGVCKPN